MPRFRRLMTGDVNAAIRGAFEGGADEVVVADGHGSGRNILIEELDGRARLNSGGSGPLSMVEGVQHGVQGTMFVGYHARSGSTDANLDHTWSDTRVANVWLNGAIGRRERPERRRLRTLRRAHYHDRRRPDGLR